MDPASRTRPAADPRPVSHRGRWSLLLHEALEAVGTSRVAPHRYPREDQDRPIPGGRFDAGVVSLAQMDVLEIHTWNSRAESVEKPDRIVLDLDPGPLTTWADVVRGARLLRQILGVTGLRSFVKTTGGKGLHVVVPLAPERDGSECYALSRAIAVAVTRSDPSRYTIALKKAGRERQILIDYLRNNRTNTSVAAYSTRATPNAPVSVPLAWEELDRAADPSRFTVKSVPARLRRLRADPWAQYFKVVQRIDDSMTPRSSPSLERFLTPTLANVLASGEVRASTKFSASGFLAPESASSL
jgi:DNA ligase D-like protein (predicted polymerase)